MPNMTVRTRIAPSPTGAPHIGTAYIALFNYAFARKNGGQFILRIEDTDQVRSTRASETMILEALRWIGLSWDEGPDTGGAHGPYRQSERTTLYRDCARQLVESGHAYPCFCSEDRLRELRKQQMEAKKNPGYDGLCRRIDPAEAAKRVASGEKHVIRMTVPESGDCVFHDRFRGDVVIPWSQVDQQILIKADGFPTYHLANVVDDHEMQITHVIRGEEWISSTPKHVLLYRHFGWKAPEFAHLPLLRNPDKSKLSKRKNPTSILYYRDAGYLPEALLNYLGLMAYSRADGQEIFSLESMVADFDLDRVSMGGPVFDLAKLESFNGKYLRAMSDDSLMERLDGWRMNQTLWRKAVPLAKPRLNTLADFVPQAAFLVADRVPLEKETLLGAGLPEARVSEVLKLIQWEIERAGDWNATIARAILERVTEKESLKFKDLMGPVFVVISGRRVALPAFESMEILGRDLVVRRFQYAQEALDAWGLGVKGKALKALEAHYSEAYGHD